MRVNRIGLGVTLTLHALVAAILLSYEPARKALLAAAPIMVDLVTPPKIEPPKPLPVAEPPKPKSVVKRVERPVPTPPILTAPADAPSPVTAPTPPPAPVEVVSTGTSDAVQVTQPNFNADYLENPAPIYPAAARRLGEEGRVILRVLVNVRGTADDVQVRTSSGFARLDDTARDTVRRWRFVPARRGAEPVAAWVLIPISFRLEG